MAAPLVAIGASLLAAGLVARMGRRVGLPTIPLFMAAGVVFGPHTPGLALVEDPAELELLATVGLVLLLFHLGLEFTLGDLVEGGPRLLGAGVLYLVLNVGGGLALGLAIGWGGAEAMVVAGVVGISSSAIVTKLLVELRRLANPETRLILGIVVVQDVFIALYLAVLEPALGGSEGPGEALWSFARAFVFLAGLVVVARFGGRLVGRLLDSDDAELLTVCFVGLALLVAGVAERFGVSDAIGAFLVGLVVAETAVANDVGRLVLPLRDAFAAMFFFAFGLTIDPGEVASVAGPLMAAIALTGALNLVASLAASRLYRLGQRAASNVSFTILARGEFSLVLASLGQAAGLDPRLGPFVAGYVLALAVGGSLLAARSGSLARFIPRRLLGSDARA